MVRTFSDPQPPQNVAVVLRIGAGSFADGFSVTLQILENGQLIQEHHDLPDIPAAPEMGQLYGEWQNRSQENSRKLQAAHAQILPVENRKLQAVPAQVTNIADLEEWRQNTERLEDYCRNWFRDQTFRSLSYLIQANTSRNDQSIPIVVSCRTGDETQDQVLRRLPWDSWDLFSSRPNAEFALLTKFHHRVSSLASPIRILAIFGSSQGGLQLEKDEAALQILQQRGAEITKLSEPSQEELTHLLFDQAWDILFFAGHSSSERASGQIQLSESVSLPLHALRQSLTRAVTQGLKLAIFNSCDGLGIADFLAELHVPVIIVMRQPVPDQIACQFLLYFLSQFSQGKPLCLAVREARDRLESLQSRFPGASWLPTVCQNPNQPDLVWTLPPLSLPPPQSLRMRLLLCLRRVPLPLIIGSIAVVGAIAVIPPIGANRCQFFPSICASSEPGDLNPVKPFISNGQQSVAGSIVRLSKPYLSLKQQGIAAFSRGRYPEAITLFDSIRSQAKQNKNALDSNISEAALTALQDPEVLIYRNNAFVNAQHAQNSALPIYTIAVAAPLNLDSGLQIIFGVAQAQDVAVQQKINLQVVIANDNNIPQQAGQIAEALSNDTRVLAVVGHYTSPNTCRGLKIYSPNHLVIVSPTSTLVDLQSNSACGGDPNKVFFRTVSNTRIEASSLVQYLVDNLNKHSPKVVAFYNSQELFSKDLYQQFVKALKVVNGSVIAEFDLSDPNFNSRQLPPEVKDADALAVLPDGQTGSNTTFQRSIDILKLNNGAKPVLGANTLYLQDVLNQAGNATINHLFLAVDWYPKQCGAEQFAKQINTYWGGDLNRRTALSYEAVQAVLQTLTPQVTREEVQQRLAETGVKADMGITAQSAIIQGLGISFDERGDRREITTRAIVTVNDQLKFDLVKDVPCPNPHP